jgi:hypothetical protein
MSPVPEVSPTDLATPELAVVPDSGQAAAEEEQPTSRLVLPDQEKQKH